MSYRKEILTNPALYDEGAVLIVGNHYNGCMLEGPSIVFNDSIIHPHNVLFGSCPIPLDSCMYLYNIFIHFFLNVYFLGLPKSSVKVMQDYCINEPCMRHGTCENGLNTYTCYCAPRYSGKNCEIDNGKPCEKKNPCKNGATCIDDAMGNYVCNCPNGYSGKLYNFCLLLWLTC